MICENCGADSWDYIIRYGGCDKCDAFTARATADKEWASSPDGIIAASGMWR